MNWTKKEVVEFLQSISVEADDFDSTYVAFCQGGFTSESYLTTATLETLRAAGVSLAVIGRILAHFSPSNGGSEIVSPAPTRGRYLPPPSDGKGPAKRPRPTSLENPSHDENSPKSRRSSLRYVAAKSLFFSSCTTAIDVVRLLEVATEDDAVDKMYVDAANHVLNVRKALVERSLHDEEVNQNERFFTGALCDALNSILGNGISVLHRGCIGKSTTHSDFSARDVRSDTGTLMVGEGKVGESSTIRDETRGQLFNELIRHRSIDAKLGFTEGARPILLIAIDFGNISIDLAFPSKKGNLMEQWVTFEDSVDQGTETFWTTQVASVYFAKAEGKKKLPKVLRFIADALVYLTRLDADHPREQFKTPFVTAHDEETPRSGEKGGENVTIIEMESGKKRVYKEFCYYLRREDGFNTPEDAIEECDQRKPPSDELLQCLGEKYGSWKVESGPFATKVLSYDFIDGGCWPTSKESWREVLGLVDRMHAQDYVHGDLLPRNMVFSGTAGYVIDFDLTRKQGEPYVKGYNHKDFSPFRHREARANQPMRKAHDAWSLTEMTKIFFDIDLSELTTGTVSELGQVFSASDPVELRDADEAVVGEATGSPRRF